MVATPRASFRRAAARIVHRGLGELERSLGRVLEPLTPPSEQTPSPSAVAGPRRRPQVVYLHGYDSSRPRVMWPAFPPAGYLGQLAPAFQRRMADDWAFVERADCDFYHTVELPSGEVVEGAWDLRGREHEYLGGIRLADRTVLELGPATGCLTFHMEANGADVVTFDVGWDRSIDLLPREGVDPAWAEMSAMAYVGAMQNSWWYLHRELGSSVRAVYGDIYRLPADLGTFEAAILGAILLHLRDPFAALAAVAPHVSEEIVVTDLVQDPEVDQTENVMRFAPQAEEHATNWWSITPGAVVHMLDRLGFGRSSVTFHTQRHHLGHRLESELTDMSMYTVVAARTREVAAGLR